MYITASDIANYLGRVLTAPETTQANATIPGIEAAANTFMNRVFGLLTPQTEVFDGGTINFFVLFPPISTITHVKVDGEEVDSESYFLYPTHIKLDSPASRGSLNVEIKYTPNSTVPEDLKLALVQWATDKILSAAVSTGVKSVTVGPASITYTDQNDQTIKGTGIPDFVRTILERYRLSPVVG